MNTDTMTIGEIKKLRGVRFWCTVCLNENGMTRSVRITRKSLLDAFYDGEDCTVIDACRLADDIVHVG